MPFSPLPATFIDDLHRLAPLGVVELGSGSGLFTELLREQGVEPVTVDRATAAVDVRPTVRGDAIDPPLRGRFGLVVAANLVRHVWVEIRRGGPTAWQRLLAPAGCLWIFEDEPLDSPPPARHYRDLQTFLAALDPDVRQPLLAARCFREQCHQWAWSGRWRDGSATNNWPTDADQVIAMLDAGNPIPDMPADHLRTAIAEDGISYGSFWWARWGLEVVD